MSGGIALALYRSANMVAALTPGASLKMGSHLSLKRFPPSEVSTS